MLATTRKPGRLLIEEPRPGVLLVRTVGHLTASVGEAFVLRAREAATRAAECSVWLDLRRLDGFEAEVRDSWARVLLQFRARVARVVVLSTLPLLTFQAKAAGVALRPLGVDFQVLVNSLTFEQALAEDVRAGTPFGSTG